MTNRSIMLIGSPLAPETREIQRTVRSLFRDSDMQQAENIPAAIHSIRSRDVFPDLVVVTQVWPDEFARTEVEALIAECAFARLVVAYGPWCDSDGRNRQVWPLAVRIPVSLIESRLQTEIDVLSGRREPLPLTANRDEVFEFDRSVDRLASREFRGTQVSVQIADEALRESVITQLAAEGIEVSEHASTKIFDADVEPNSRGLGIAAMPECHSSPTVSKLAPVDALANAVAKHQNSSPR